MRNQNTNNQVDYRKIVQVDAWKAIFDAISRLTTAEEDLCSINVKFLQELFGFAEDVKEKVAGNDDLERTSSTVYYAEVARNRQRLKLE